MATWRREGNCNQCGECCKTLVSEWFMTGFDPTSSVRPSGCQFLKLVSSKYICEITKGLFYETCKVKIGTQVKRHPRTNELQDITQDVYDYWERECKPFPNPNDPAHCPTRYVLPEKCGYRMVEVV